jgi:succinate-semialdehyde dehydrogenase/glutarate-semialdehyde dehydrogenase
MGETRRMFIDGQWVEGEAGRTFTVVDPATGEAVGEVADGGPAETARAIDAAHRAFPAWAAMPARERAPILHRVQALMEARRDDLARLVTRENGKPFEEARREVSFALGYFGWFAEEAGGRTGTWCPRPSGTSGSGSSTSRSASSAPSRPGTSRPPWSPARSPRPWPPAARSS